MYYVNALFLSLVVVTTGSLLFFQNCTQNNVTMKNEALSTQLLVPNKNMNSENLSSLHEEKSSLETNKRDQSGDQSVQQ